MNMDDDEGEGDLQICDSGELDLQVWEDDLTEEQKVAFESKKKSYVIFQELKKGLSERKKSGSCEFWTKKRTFAPLPSTPQLMGNVNGVNLQRIQVGGGGGQKTTSVPIVITSGAGSSSQPLQTYISRQINYTPTTSVNAVHSAQLSSVRATPPNMAQPMSVLHRGGVQQPMQNMPRGVTSVPVQQFQNLLFDANSGLLIMPTVSQAGMVPNTPLAIRAPLVRQPTAPGAPSSIRPTIVGQTPIVTPRLVNSNIVTTSNSLQAQQLVKQAQQAQGTKRVYTGPSAVPKPTVQQQQQQQQQQQPQKSMVGPAQKTMNVNSILTQQSLSSMLQSRPTSKVTQLYPAPKPGGVHPSGAGPASLRQPAPLAGSSNGSLVSSAIQNQLNKTYGTNNKTMYAKPVNSTLEKQQQQQNAPMSNGIENTTIMNGSSDTNNNTSSSGSNSKTFPSLVVNVKPCLLDKPPRAETAASRTELDQIVKNALVYAPSRFTEWLMQKGLLRLEHKCFLHKGEDGQPVAMKLGMYSDKDKEPFSGGYVWISDCCSGRQISVYEGSIFDSSNHPPTTLLKLIYHWACQTSAANVMNWCKVSGGYLKNFYTLLRSVCVGALHELCPKMGGTGKYIEIGIITLGTTLSAPTGKKQVKIEILGVFDPESKMIRMKLINPAQPTSTVAEASKIRGVQILSPLNIWVDKSSTILIDTSIEQDLLLEMGYKNLIQGHAPTEEGYDPDAPTNVNVMNYLKHVVPKMFQNTLCVLSKSLIQQFLDELSWREKWGKTPSNAFDHVLEHIKTMTNWDFGPNGSLVAYLNKISMNPFQDWSFSRSITVPSGIDLLPESIRRGDAMPALSSQVHSQENRHAGSNGYTNFAPTNQSSSRSTGSKPPVLLPQVPTLTIANGPVKRKQEPAVSAINLTDHFLKSPKTIILESYYYAELPGIKKDTSGEFPQHVKCPLCSKPFFSNLEVYRHIYSHVHAIGRAPSSSNFCTYCLKDVPQSSLQTHIQEQHKMTKGDGYCCRICAERFPHESMFVIHMWENHCEADTPYSCELCDYKSSFQYQVIDHYNQHHKGTDSVMCPVCMKILSAKSYYCLKQITVHIQTHEMRKGKKCSHCSLLFFGDLDYRAHIAEGAHERKPLNSRKVIYFSPEDKGLLMAKPPPVNRALVQPPSKKSKISSDIVKKSVAPAKPTSTADNMYSIREHSIVMNGTEQRGCLECHTLIERSEHFPGYMRCIKCRFSTCCKSAMQLHHANAHPSFGAGRKSSSIKVKNTEMLMKPLLCPCGFETINPNRLARHLALCDKTTAFPLDWEEQQRKRAGQPPPEPLTPLDHLEMMRDPSR